MKKLFETIALSSLLVLPAENYAATLPGMDFLSQGEIQSQTADVNNVDSYEGQAVTLINQLVAVVPQLAGQAFGNQFAQTLASTSGSVENLTLSVHLAEGLDATVSDVNLMPIGANLTFAFNGYELIQEGDYNESVYVSGAVESAFSYDIVAQKMTIQLDSVDDSPVVYEGGRLEGTTVLFRELTITTRTQQLIPFWEPRTVIRGNVLVNGVEIPVEEIVNLIGQ